MDSRATTWTRLSVIPILIALLVNIVVPVLAVAVPQVTPQALQPQVAEAADAPDQVTFTLEGCNLNNGTFIEATLMCTDPGYTTGNLGKLWAELDRVPHRLTAENNGATQTYEIKISADHLNDGTVGYDIISVPALKSGPCTFTVGNQTIDAGQAGGADTTIFRILTITQPADSTCVFDYNMRLALGSSGYSGSSLHAYLLAEGVGEKRVPLPVDKDFPAQELRKTMTAVVGQAFIWNVTKSSEPASLDFPNTCATSEDALSKTVEVTVSWTRSSPVSSGSTVITTEVFAKNPSERTINVSVSDSIYAGTDQSSPALDTVSAGPTAVPANTELKLLTHQFTYTGTATQFNDVATATYTDPVNPDVQIPGNTTATASATAAPAGGTPANASAVITDTESITGTGLSFSVAELASGSFTNGYVAGASVSGSATVEWSSGTVSDSGSITFEKTVTVDEPRISSGTLTDTATVTSTDGQQTFDTSDPLNIDVTTDAQVELTISKTIPAGSLRVGETVTFDFEITGDGFSDDASITFHSDDPSTKSTTLTGLDPGTYTVHEVPQAHWLDQADEEVTITLPDCDGSVSFSNIPLAPGLNIIKRQVDENGDPTTEPILAGETAFFEILVVNQDAEGVGTAKDVVVTEGPEDLPDGVSWSIDAPTGVTCVSGVSTDEPQSFTCNLGDLEPGEEVSIIVSGLTDREDCGALVNTARVDASNNEDEVPPAQETIFVRCPTLVIDKVAEAEVIEISGSGDDLVATPSVVTWTLSYTLTDGPVTNAVITDEVPEGFVFLDASDGGTETDGVVTWILPSPLNGSGTVTFRTTVDPETISRTDPTVNTAVIDSDETEPDDGEDSVTVAVEPPPLGGNPTLELPDTALIAGPNGERVTVPVELLVTLFLGSLGALALANERARNRRR